jgi:AbiV family abortive infection protein
MTAELSVDELDALAQAVRDNSQGLLLDAKLLMESKRYPRAFALAELAAEEVGKLILVAATAIRVAVEMPVDWRRFWRNFRHHPPKAWNAALIDRIMAVNAQAWAEGDVAAIMADAEGLQEARRQAELMPPAKNDALYVDHRQGWLREPANEISEDQARAIVSGVETLLASLQARGFPPGRGLLPQAAANPAFRERFRPQAERFAAVDPQVGNP